MAKRKPAKRRKATKRKSHRRSNENSLIGSMGGGGDMLHDKGGKGEKAIIG